jgi:hypothetical protein
MQRQHLGHVAQTPKAAAVDPDNRSGWDLNGNEKADRESASTTMITARDGMPTLATEAVQTRGNETIGEGKTFGNTRPQDKKHSIARLPKPLATNMTSGHWQSCECRRG